MISVLKPVLYIQLRQILILDYQQILRIFFFSGFRKIETSGNHNFPVYNYNLVMGDSMFVIN